MTKQEKLIISAYTSYLMVNIDEFQAFVESTLEHPIWTHELAEKEIFDELRKKLRPQFIALCADESDDKPKEETP